ncbi:MAG: acyltransferase [Coriobacteriales bacterium]|jgi:hypothetical protein
MPDRADEAVRREAMAPEDGFVYDFWDTEIIAAGAVVAHDIPDNVLAGGVPAKVIKPIEDDVERG